MWVTVSKHFTGGVVGLKRSGQDVPKNGLFQQQSTSRAGINKGIHCDKGGIGEGNGKENATGTGIDLLVVIDQHEPKHDANCTLVRSEYGDVGVHHRVGDL